MGDDGEHESSVELGDTKVVLNRIWLSISVSSLQFPPSSHTGFYAMVLYSKPWGSTSSNTRYVEAARTEVV